MCPNAERAPSRDFAKADVLGINLRAAGIAAANSEPINARREKVGFFMEFRI
jgi:hypothetical protein